jgi:hypothetical protein
LGRLTPRQCGQPGMLRERMVSMFAKSGVHWTPNPV